ncbi:MAG: hypothetical protein DCC67_16430 [Planctomycetota bacterium]|nr:MAG: hypothetical protein DCC67_16430 [Planctomycetota bacterium]
MSENKRYLARTDGSPFFYLGDTAWELFHRTSREDADRYLADRAAKGFTVIQAVALAELDGLNTPNAYGRRPLIENDPARPDVKDGPDNDYWDHVDYIVSKAESLGLFVGLLPTWGDKWNKKWGVGPEIFTPENASAYGEWLGKRYRDKPIIWILGGDRPIENDAHRAIIEAMARGLRRGDGGEHLITFHPIGCRGSSEWFHQAEWLDFNMRQNGHGVNYQSCYAGTRADYERTPVKPVIDGEPVYEDHPIAFKAAENGHSIAADVRRAMYWDLLSGACGHTYGHHSIWQMAAPGRDPVNGPLLPWYEAINQPGATHMQYGRRLIESRGGGALVPDDSLIVQHKVPTAVPGAGRLRMVAARDDAGRFALVYTPAGRPFRVQLAPINGPRIAAWWYNPRKGDAVKIGEFSADREHVFTPPDNGEYLDWVLVLDSTAEGFPPPGQTAN